MEVWLTVMPRPPVVPSLVLSALFQELALSVRRGKKGEGTYLTNEDTEGQTVEHMQKGMVSICTYVNNLPMFLYCSWHHQGRRATSADIDVSGLGPQRSGSSSTVVQLLF